MKRTVAACAALAMAITGIALFVPARSAFAADSEVMNNGDTPYYSATTTTTDDGSNTFTHALYFTVESGGEAYTSNYSNRSVDISDSVLNLDKLTKGADGLYHFNAVMKITALNAIGNLQYWLTLPSSTAGSQGAPDVQLTGDPQFTIDDPNADTDTAKRALADAATAMSNSTEYSNKASAGRYSKIAEYKAQYGDPMPDIYYMHMAGALGAGQTLTVTLPYALKNLNSLDLTQTSSSVAFSETINGSIGLLPWGLYTDKGAGTTRLRFARSNSAAYSPYWSAYDSYKSDPTGTSNLDYIYTVNNKISTATSYDYTYTNVHQISNDIVGLDASDISYHNANMAANEYQPLTQMLAAGTPAYANGGFYRINLAKVKKAFDGTGWSTNGMYTQYYTYDANSPDSLAIHGKPATDPSRPLMYIELWHYISAAEKVCLTVGDTFKDSDALYWVRPYNGAEVRNPLNDEAQKKLIEVTYTDAWGNKVAKVDTSKPGKYTVNYRYYNPKADGSRDEAVSTSVNSTIYTTSERAASCPAQYTISYNANAGAGSIADQTVGFLDSATLSDGAAFTREGYTLTGWNTAADGSGTAYSLGQKLDNIAGNITLYAQWTKNAENQVIPTKPRKDNALAKTGADIAGMATAVALLAAAGTALMIARSKRKF